MNDRIAYKVLAAEEWPNLQSGSYRGSPLDIADGYIHLSTASQLTRTVEKHFADKQGLIVAAVDLNKVGVSLRWEPSRNGQCFPHLYAPLTIDAVVGWCTLEHDAAGLVKLPP